MSHNYQFLTQMLLRIQHTHNTVLKHYESPDCNGVVVVWGEGAQIYRYEIPYRDLVSSYGPELDAHLTAIITMLKVSGHAHLPQE